MVPSNNHTSKRLNVGRHATWLELFYDLVYVAAIANLTKVFLHNLTFVGFLNFALLFMPVIWAWTGHTMLSNRFDTDDAFHRILTFAQMFGALLLAVFVKNAYGNDANAFALSFFGIRLILIVLYLRVYFHVQELKKLMKFILTGFGIGSSLWLISVFFAEPTKYYLWAIGLMIDFATPLFKNKQLAEVPVHASHLPERLGLFMIIVLGESIIAVVNGVSEINWTLNTIIIAICAFILAVSIWWIYFEYLSRYVIGKNLGNGQLYIYGHIPIYLGLVTLAVGLEQNILSDPDVSQNAIRTTISGGMLLFLIPLTFFQTVKLPNIKILKLLYIDFVLLAMIMIFGFSADHMSTIMFSILSTFIFLLFVIFKHHCCFLVEKEFCW